MYIDSNIIFYTLLGIKSEINVQSIDSDVSNSNLSIIRNSKCYNIDYRIDYNTFNPIINSNS